MNQKEFTEYIIPKLVGHFPQFKDFITLKPNDIIDIDYKSNNGKLVFWLTTQDREITLGITGETECDWHTHMSLFGANEPDEELSYAINFIEEVITDKKIIVHSNLLGFYPTDEPIIELEKQKEDKEKLKFYKWSEL